MPLKAEQRQVPAQVSCFEALWAQHGPDWYLSTGAVGWVGGLHAVASVCVRQGTLGTSLPPSERLSHTTPKRSSQTFPWVFLIAV